MIDGIQQTMIPHDASTPAWLSTLQQAVHESVSPDDVSAMIAAQVKKAKDGDTKACKFVLDLVGGNQQQRSGRAQQLMQNNFYLQLPGETEPRLVESYTLSTRERLYAYLESMGPTKPGVIAADLNLPAKTVREELNHEWFSKCRGGYQVAIT